MILGFTGTRRGMTPAQRAALPGVLAVLPERVVFGGADGADEEFGQFILDHQVDGLVTCALTVYPASADRWHRWVKHAATIYEPMAPLERNKLITGACDHLLATPAEPDEVLRSGTWTTIRYARTAGKPITIIAPDGTVREERR